MSHLAEFLYAQKQTSPALHIIAEDKNTFNMNPIHLIFAILYKQTKFKKCSNAKSALVARRYLKHPKMEWLLNTKIIQS